LFYDGVGLGEGSTRFDEEIVKDWADYLKDKTDSETVSYF